MTEHRKKRWGVNHAWPSFVFPPVCTVRSHTWCQGWLPRFIYSHLRDLWQLCVASIPLCCKGTARGNVTFYSTLCWWQIQHTWLAKLGHDVARWRSGFSCDCVSEMREASRGQGCKLTSGCFLYVTCDYYFISSYLNPRVAHKSALYNMKLLPSQKFFFFNNEQIHVERGGRKSPPLCFTLLSFSRQYQVAHRLLDWF